jgi:hypothetical protein
MHVCVCVCGCLNVCVNAHALLVYMHPDSLPGNWIFFVVVFVIILLCVVVVVFFFFCCVLVSLVDLCGCVYLCAVHKSPALNTSS